MDVNDLDVNDLEQELAEKPKNKRPTGNSAKTKVLDPEEDKANWPVIFIDFEDGKPNYEYVATSGTMEDGRPFTHSLQIMRGVDVAVPPSIVNNLRTAVERRTSQVPNPTTGRIDKVFTMRSAIPWHIVEKGKYIK
jgi:hypothetical protein